MLIKCQTLVLGFFYFKTAKFLLRKSSIKNTSENRKYAIQTNSIKNYNEPGCVRLISLNCEAFQETKVTGQQNRRWHSLQVNSSAYMLGSLYDQLVPNRALKSKNHPRKTKCFFSLSDVRIHNEEINNNILQRNKIWTKDTYSI